MTDTYAKPIVDGKFWIVEQDGEKVGTLHKKENNKFMLSSKSGQHFFGRKEELIKAFGKDFFGTKIETTVSSIEVRDVYGYPTSCYPHNPMFNVQKKLPLFTKSRESKSIFCAGYYLIHFNKGWLKAFCPKLITIERNESRGPFKTKLEMKQAFANVKSN
jgi:hypothetical protein